MSQRQTVTILLPSMERSLSEDEEMELTEGIHEYVESKLDQIMAQRRRANHPVDVRLKTRDSSPSSPISTVIYNLYHEKGME